MTAQAQRSRTTGARRIIERPRLIKLLDDAQERTILLVAPAGYGKTTLARQWAKSLNRSIWITLTAAHRDVARLAEDLAIATEAIGGDARPHISEYVRAQSNPQRAYAEIGSAIASKLNDARVEWVVIDDYQEATSSMESGEVLRIIQDESNARMLIASRICPAWATGRRLTYGEAVEFRQHQLAMTDEESRRLLGNHPEVDRITAQARGWPAALGLAAVAQTTDPLPPELPIAFPPGAFHQYLAEELFHSATDELQETLLQIALLGDLSEDSLQRRLGPRADDLLSEARVLGFDSGEGQFELHPLIREFLLKKLLGARDAEDRVRWAVSANLADESWDLALELVRTFKLHDLVEPVLEHAFKPLVRRGRFASLSAFAEEASAAPTFPPPTVEVAQAEVALRDGHLELARDLSRRVIPLLQSNPPHPLRSRAAALLGLSSFLLADFEGADDAFLTARACALDEFDETEALHGRALASVFGERPGAAAAVRALGEIRSRSPADLARYTTAKFSLLRIVDPEGLRDNVRLAELGHLRRQVDDPRARSSFTYSVAGALAQLAEYKEAREWLALCFEDAETLGLEFVMPYANWTHAQISLGLRRFGEAERAIQNVEDAAARTRDRHHGINASSLRARLYLQTGKIEEALACLQREPEGAADPIVAWRVLTPLEL